VTHHCSAIRPVLHPQQIGADAFLPARSQPRVPTVDCDEVVLGNHPLHLQAQRVGKTPDEVDKIVAAFRELRSTLREARRPVPRGHLVVPGVEQ
jgi:hypothetical protein